MGWRYLVLGVVLVGAVFFAQQLTATAAANRTGAMALDCDASTPGIQTSCTYDSGATFSVQLHVTKAPIEGYVAFQAKVRWTDDVLDYLPTDNPIDEALWPECDIAARADNSVGLPDRPIEPSVLFGCIPFPLISEGDTFIGAVLEFAFQCGEESYTPLELVAGAPLGTYFSDEALNPIEPLLTEAEVGCGIDPPTPTPCPPVGCPTATPTPTVTPTITPRPTSTPCPPDGCSDTLGPIGGDTDVDGPNPNAPGIEETPTVALTPSPLPETPRPPKPTDVAVAPTPSLPETPMQTSVAGVSVSALPQTGARLVESESGPWSKLAIALAAVAALAAGAGAYRLRRRERR